mmetsp:Transcript_6023/g.6157  ORF Transcript_6023/g.6157 Transcript_6023/m.6157 type:complete len:352 (+) Transcript_6023:147-1202(+)
MAETMITPFYSVQNLCNAFLELSVAVPIIFAGIHVIYNCPLESLTPITQPILDSMADSTVSELYCRIGLYHPLIFVNIVFFFCVNVTFWVISLIQKSVWLIDAYWTLIPPMIAAFYYFHPLNQGEPNRCQVTFYLTLIWSIRLTHSYFRRENFRFGAREDWRFQDMRKEDPKNFLWKSFFLAYLSQQVMLVGVTLPLWAVNFNQGMKFGFPDYLSLASCLVALLISYVADKQLRNYMIENCNRVTNGMEPVLVLNTGLWKYSRHPNYFGEQLWWFSLSIFGRIAGQRWTVLGALVNSASMMYVTHLTEKRMQNTPERTKAYKAYSKLTSMLFPFYPDEHTTTKTATKIKGT